MQIRYKNHTDLKNELLKDVMPICFDVSVYQTDAKDQMVEKSTNSRTNDDCRIQDEAGQSIDASFVALTVVGNRLSSVTYEDVEAMQAPKSTNELNIPVEKKY